MPQTKKHKTHVVNLPRGQARKPADAILADLLLELFRDNTEPVLVAIGGPGGTGKSTFSQAMADRLPDAAVVRLDDYKTPRRVRQEKNLFGAHPEANRMDLIRQHLERLHNGRSIAKPAYDNHTGEAYETVEINPSRFIMLDGEISTYPEFREFVDFAIFIDSDWTTQLKTRTSRDVQIRGYTREKAIATFLQSNLREFAKFGAASKAWADVHLYSHDDYHLEIESVSDALFCQFHEMLDKYLAAIDLAGLVTAVTTPFDEDGRIDRTAFIAHLEFLAHHGIKRILVNGTTGEFFSLHPQERKQMLTLARRYFPGVIFFQAGSDSLALTLEAVGWAEKYGADAVVVLPPYYFCTAPTAGLVDWFRKIADATDLPLILYNFPLHTRNPLTAELLDAVPHFGLKDSSADLGLLPATPHYYIGNDRMIVETYRQGGYGFVSGLANLFPEPFVRIETACRAGDYETAEKVQDEIGKLVECYNDNLIGKVKAALSQHLPNYPPYVRPPLTVSYSLTA